MSRQLSNEIIGKIFEYIEPRNINMWYYTINTNGNQQYKYNIKNNAIQNIEKLYNAIDITKIYNYNNIIFQSKTGNLRSRAFKCNSRLLCKRYINSVNIILKHRYIILYSEKFDRMVYLFYKTKQKPNNSMTKHSGKVYVGDKEYDIVYYCIWAAIHHENVMYHNTIICTIDNIDFFENI